MGRVLFIVAQGADNSLGGAFGLQADQVQDLSLVVPSLCAGRVLDADGWEGFTLDLWGSRGESSNGLRFHLIPWY